MAFIDFREAFDSVCRENIWNILYENGLIGKIVNVLKSMYDVVKSKVGAGGDLTGFYVPQGVETG